MNFRQINNHKACTKIFHEIKNREIAVGLITSPTILKDRGGKLEGKGSRRREFKATRPKFGIGLYHLSIISAPNYLKNILKALTNCSESWNLVQFSTN